jgi:hypothetical protein
MNGRMAAQAGIATRLQTNGAATQMRAGTNWNAPRAPPTPLTTSAASSRPIAVAVAAAKAI